MSRTHLMLRVMARCGGTAEALALQRTLMHTLARFHPVPHGAPEAVPGDAASHEICLAWPGPQHAAAVVALAPARWTCAGDEHDVSWVWNPAPGAVFLHPAVYWAEVLSFDA